jgi:hypothetical protein
MLVELTLQSQKWQGGGCHTDHGLAVRGRGSVARVELQPLSKRQCNHRTEAKAPVLRTILKLLNQGRIGQLHPSLTTVCMLSTRRLGVDVTSGVNVILERHSEHGLTVALAVDHSHAIVTAGTMIIVGHTARRSMALQLTRAEILATTTIARQATGHGGWTRSGAPPIHMLRHHCAMVYVCVCVCVCVRCNNHNGCGGTGVVSHGSIGKSCTVKRVTW